MAGTSNDRIKSYRICKTDVEPIPISSGGLVLYDKGHTLHRYVMQCPELSPFRDKCSDASYDSLLKHFLKMDTFIPITAKFPDFANVS